MYLHSTKELASFSQTAPLTNTDVPLFQTLRSALVSGQWNLALTLAFLSGKRDINQLTNMIFFARHPERREQKLEPDEPNFKQLSQEWLEIRDRMVRPFLNRTTTGEGRPTIPAAEKEPRRTPATGGAIADLPMGPFGTLTINAPDRYRFRYKFTPDDALWLARMVKGETGGKDDPASHAVIWAMFNRFGLFTHAGSYWMQKYKMSGYKTFASFVQSYSTTLQPVLNSPKAAKRAIGYARENPKKFKYIETGGYYTGTNIPKGQLEHHLERIQKMTWSSFPEELKSLIIRALRGQVENPIGIASEFGSTYVYFRDRHKRYPNDTEWRQFTEAYAAGKNWVWIGPVPHLNQKTNAFFIQKKIAGLSNNAVQVIPNV